MTESPFPIQHGCKRGRWCGQCRANRDAGFPEAFEGNGTHPRERAGGVTQAKSSTCPHLGQREPGSSRDLRECDKGLAAPIHGRSLVVCCNVVNEGEWQLGEKCGPSCSGYPMVQPLASAYVPLPLAPPDTPWPVPQGRPTIDPNTYITTARMLADAIGMIQQLPPTIDLVIGCARSGLMPAAAIATHLHLPLWTFTDARGLQPGTGGYRTQAHRRNGFSHALIVDDTSSTGRQMRIARQVIGSEFSTLSTAVVYATPEAAKVVDYCAAILPPPHYLEWNWPNAGHGAACDYDFDGILCRDPLREEDDDGERYSLFLANAEPLFLPRRTQVPNIVTARHEKHRAASTKWLVRHGVRAGQLTMRGFDVSGEWHQVVGEWKGRQYQQSASTLFAESDPKQAEVIAKVSGKPVLCPAAGKVLT